MKSIAISANGISASIGNRSILQGIDLQLPAGRWTSIVGPNGAGKSTAMKAVFGLLKVRGGCIVFDGEDITGWAPDRIVHRGVCYVPQVDNVFREMTVHENFEMGAFLRRGDLSAAFDRVYGLFPDLKAKRRNHAGDLSGGQRPMVAMGPRSRRLTSRGMAVFVHEWRGHGTSSLRAGRSEDWGYRELLLHDIPASEAAIVARVPGAERIVGGHSLGGQLASCYAGLTAHEVHRLWLVASGAPICSCSICRRM